MALRLKNTSEVAKVFGVTAIGSFANNTAIKNSPQLIQLLLAKKAHKQFKTKNSKFEKDYYKRLIARSEEIKAERSTIGKSNKLLEPRLVNNNVQSKLAIKNRLSSYSEAEKDQNAVKIDREVVASQTAIQAETLPDLYWESDKGRYYHVTVERNLFCGYSLIKSWGGISNKLGNYQTRFYDTLEDVLKNIKLVMKQRQYKKYKLIESLNVPL